MMKLGEFKRASRSISYTRAWGDGKQKVDFEVIVRPRYASDAIQLSLSASFVSAGISDIARRMLPSGEDFIVRNNVIHRVMLDQMVRNPALLTFVTDDELGECLADIRGLLENSVIPYLDARSSVDEFVGECTRSLLSAPDDGLPRGPWPVVVAASQSSLGRRQEALETLEFSYPPASPERAHYADAFAVAAGD